MFHDGRIAAIALSLGLLAFAGCQRQRTFDPVYSVSGSVTLDGKPLADGTIAFLTDQSGDVQTLAIANGRYEGEARAGTRRVEIRACLPGKKGRTPMDPPPKNFLPKRYNLETTLSATVTAAGPNRFDFELKSK